MTKYHLVRDQLLDRLDGMAAGEPLPPERELAAQLHVSRMTLRRAVDELVARGAVRRRKGAGVFAQGPKVHQSLVATSFTEEMRARGMKPGSQVLSFEVHESGARIARELEIDPADDITVISRLRLADDEPLALEELCVPRSVLPDLQVEGLHDYSFYELLRQRRGLQIADSIQTIEPTVLDAREAAHLQVPVRAPALLFERTSRAQDGTRVEFVRSVYRGDRYKIRAELGVSTAAPVSQEVYS